VSTVRIDLDMAANMLGKPLGADVRARLAAVVDHPSNDTWEDAHGIILAPHPGFGLTLWQAVIAVDPSFPQRGPSYTKGHVTGQWDRIPTTDLLIQAINYATR
jgi:hypothetical protein